MALVLNQNRTAHWVRYIHQRIERNKNFVCFVGGPTGGGKSWSCLSIAEQTDPNFTIENVVFDAKALMERINSGQLKTGSVLIFEEAGVSLSSKNWQSTLNKVINYLFQTFRHKRYILFLNSPYMDFIDASTRKLFHAEFKTITINKATQSVVIKPQVIQYNDRKDKFYYKFLRVITGPGMRAPVKTWSVEKPSPALIDAYEKKKDEFTKKLNREIEAQLYSNDEKETKREFKCTLCGHQWQPKGKNPSCCPKCRKNKVIEATPPNIAGVSEKITTPI